MTQKNPYSFESVVAFFQENFAIVLVVAIFFVGGFVGGSLWTENKLLKGGTAGAPSAIAPGVGAPTELGGDTGPTADQLGQMPEVTSEDHSKGSSKPVVTLVEYSDYNCPFCQRFQGTMDQVLEDYGDQVTWVKRNMPVLGSTRQAQAVECAAQIGGETAFWAFNEYYYASIAGTPDRGSDAQLQEAATAAGISASELMSCLESGQTADIVNAQMQGGQAAGITGTPGTVVVTSDGPQELIGGALPFDQVSAIIEKYL